MYSKEKQGEPAVEIYELAVHKDYQKQGIGTDIIKTIFAQVYELSEKYLGIKHIVVCAKPTAINFYKKFNFKEIDKLVPRTYDNKNCVAMSVRSAFLLKILREKYCQETKNIIIANTLSKDILEEHNDEERSD